MGRVLADGVKLVPWIVSILQRQKEQEHESQQLISGGSIDLSALEGVVRSAVHSLEDAATINDTLDEHVGETDKKGKGKGKARDRLRAKHPAHGELIWLHCSVGEPGSLEEETETTAEKQQVSALVPQGISCYVCQGIRLNRHSWHQSLGLIGFGKLALARRR